MSENKFSENMVVCAVGNLSPGNISDSCESCPHNKFSFPGVLIAGVTKDAVMLLSEKVEIVPEGTRAKVAELEAINKELLEALKHARGFIIRYGTIKEGAGFVDSPMFSSLYEKMSGAINKAEEEQNNE